MAADAFSGENDASSGALVAALAEYGFDLTAHASSVVYNRMLDQDGERSA